MKVMVIGNGNAVFKEIEDKLDDYYREIGCDYIDIVSYPINGRDYEIIVDDEGLLKTDPIVRAVGKDGKPLLVGTLIIARYDKKGRLKGLKPEDVLPLTNSIQYSIQYNKVEPIIVVDM